MNIIKLLKIGIMENGAIRLQSQLAINKNIADFIIENGVLKIWDCRNGAYGFYITNIPYEIIEDKKEMVKQSL